LKGPGTEIYTLRGLNEKMSTGRRPPDGGGGNRKKGTTTGGKETQGNKIRSLSKVIKGKGPKRGSSKEGGLGKKE